jgi:hypothetical protein
MESFNYDCTYYIVRAAATRHGVIPAFNHLRAKIVKLNSRRLQSTMSDIETSDLLRGEPPTLYQFICRHKRNTTRLVRSVRNGKFIIQTSSTGIATDFITFIQRKHASIEAESDSVLTLVTSIRPGLPQDLEHSYEAPICQTEIHTPITSAGQTGAPGRDRLGLSFYKATWPIIWDYLCLILNPMLLKGLLSLNKN